MSKSSTPRAMPAGVTGVVGVLAVLAAAVAMTAAGLFPERPHVPVALVPVFFLVLTAAGALILRFRFREQVMALDLFEAALAPAIMVMPATVIVPLVAIAQVSSNMVRRNQPIKSAFNVAQWSTAAGIGVLTYRAIAEGSNVSARNLSALVAAMTAVAIVNAIAFATVIKVAEGERIGSIVQHLLPAFVLGWATNTAFGCFFAYAYRGNALSVALFGVPLGVLAWSYRGYAAAIADRTRLRGMHDAIRTLSEPIDPRDALPRFLEQVRACFAASAVELALAQNGGRIVYRATESGHKARVEMEGIESIVSHLLRSGEATRLLAREADHAIRDLLDRESWNECLAAPVIDGGNVVGVLCAYEPTGPEGWEEGELAVLQALAREAGVVLRKGALLAAIVDERAKLQTLVNNTHDGILALDSAGRVVIWNPAIERITGFRADEVRDARALEPLNLRDANDGTVMLDAWNALPIDPPSELTVTTRAGVTRALSCSYSRVTDAGRGPLLIVVARDVTEAREIERLKDDFVATVSHELRTPLTPILGWAETLLHVGDKIAPEDRDDALRSIRRQAVHLEQLIVNLLEVAKIERGRSFARNERIDPAEVARAVVHDFQTREPLRQIRADISDEALSAFGDEVLVRQILTNLMSNALKYSPASEPIRVSVAQRGSHVEMTVEDHGPGIAPSDRNLVFERFHRLGDPLRRAQGGAGLGLYIARQLAQSIQATVELDSIPGAGSVFTLKLRVASAPARLSGLEAMPLRAVAS